MAKVKSKRQKIRTKAKKQLRRQSAYRAVVWTVIIAQYDTKVAPLRGYSLTITNLKPHQSARSQFSFVSLPLPSFFLFLLVLCLGLEINNLSFVSQADRANATSKPIAHTYGYKALNNLKIQTATLRANQAQHKLNLTNESQMWSELDTISGELATGQTETASERIQNYADRLAILHQQVKTDTSISATPTPSVSATTLPPANQTVAPIIMYHYTPPDLETQLISLKDKGYTTITMDNLSDHLRYGRPLPNKPVVLSFDDGYSNQMQAYEILQRLNMKATFYIITSGDASSWCIGVARHYDQTPSCGDAYLNWEQVKTLDRSGVIEIASHTVDHLNLASQSREDQITQLKQSKNVLEEALGHPIHHLAYPYGAFNQDSIEIAQKVGYTTAVTTQLGSEHSRDSIYTLSRERNAYSLP